MRLLLDNCVDRRLARRLPSYEVVAASSLGWAALTNGELIAAATASGFRAIITTDTGMQHQQNVAALRIAIIVLRAPTNRLSDLLPLLPGVERALRSLPDRGVIEVRVDRGGAEGAV